MHKVVIRHQIHDVRNEDYYWLPWDESMKPAKKDEPKEKAKKPAYVSMKHTKKEGSKEEKAKSPVYVSISRLSSLVR